MHVREQYCRVCEGDLLTILNLGTLALSTFPLPTDASPLAAPLDLCQCERCGLVQLRHTVDPDLLFRQYWYQSGINETMRAELRHVVAKAQDRVALKPGEIVLDVGANDGTLLTVYPALGLQPTRVAVEPAENLTDALAPCCDDLFTTYFPDPVLTRRYQQQVRILTSIACFYDLDNPRAFVSAVQQLLASDGVWVVQFQDLDQMLKATAFDNLCHEHLIYYSLGSFERLIESYGLTVVGAERRTINGGSLRLTVMHAEAAARQQHTIQAHAVQLLRDAEQGCERWLTLEYFAWRVGEARRQIQAALAAAHGQTIDLYGASTKGNTLLQYCGIGPEVVRQAWERSREKWGRTTVTGIPIVSEDEGRADRPDLLLCGIWQFREAVLQREAAYLAGGGTILFPLPAVDLVKGVPS